MDFLLFVSNCILVLVFYDFYIKHSYGNIELGKLLHIGATHYVEHIFLTRSLKVD